MFDKWDSFYVIVGSAAGALIGLQFVVITLIADRPGARSPEGNAAFSTPTIVHFCAVLALSAALRVPWETDGDAGIACMLLGACGVAYTLLVSWRMRRQKIYAPDLEDWTFHAVFPLAAYVLLTVSAVMLAPFGMGGAALLLLFAAIHNAWDAAAFHVLTGR